MYTIENLNISEIYNTAIVNNRESRISTARDIVNNECIPSIVAAARALEKEIGFKFNLEGFAEYATEIIECLESIKGVTKVTRTNNMIIVSWA